MCYRLTNVHFTDNLTSREKSQKVSDSHRNDVSPLTQGLCYRAACDELCGSVLTSVGNEKYLRVTVSSDMSCVMKHACQPDLYQSQPEIKLHQEESERDSWGIEMPGLHYTCQIEYGICMHRMRS